MNLTRQWPRLITVALLLSLAGSVSAQDSTPRAYAPVQKGFVTDAETTIPYAQDRLLVRFGAAATAAPAFAIPMERGAQIADARTGFASLDQLAQTRGVVSVERPYIMPEGGILSADDSRDRWFLYRFQTDRDMADVAREFSADPNVEAVSLDWRAYPEAVPNDPIYPDHWGHNNTSQMISYDWSTHTHTGPTVGTPGFDSHAEEAWDKSQGYGASSIVVAIIDTGVDIDHPDLNLVAGYDYGDNDSNPDDNSASAGHGTACAGVAAAIANNGLGITGIAGGCSVMPLKVANSAGSLFFSSIQNALYHAADNGADVASMSFSADITSDPATNAALQYAYNGGVLLLAATSNYNENHTRYPANNQYVMGIGAASPCGGRKRSASSPLYLNPGVDPDPNDYSCDGERWWGSNYGVTTPDAGNAVDVIAPTILPTTDIQGSGGYASGDYSMWFNGTSCATPYAAGVAVLVKSANPTFTPAQLRDAIVNSATDVVNVESGAGWDRYSGYGMVNADAAVGGGTPTPPTADFSGTPTSGDAPLLVSFTDASTGSPTSWSWDFGDGSGTSTAQNPQYTYTTAGIYTVSLTATNAAGSDVATKVDYITVTQPPQDPPVADFVGTPTSGDHPLNVSFTDLSSNNPTSWSWDFGDGSGTSTQQNPQYTYTAAGSYTVSLTATNAFGSDVATKVDYITVTDPPVATDMYVFDIVVTRIGGGNKRGQAVVTIYDSNDQPLSGATVTGDFSGRITESGVSGVTDGAGQVTLLTSGTTKGGGGDICFAVTGVTHASYTYNSTLNNVTESCQKAGDIAGSGLAKMSTVPPAFELGQNHPNPFNPTTLIRFSLREESAVSLDVYNVAGQRVATLVDGRYPAGEHFARWDASKFSSGIYFYRLEAEGFTATRSMILVK